MTTTIEEDKRALREKWYEEGYFGAATLADRMAEGAQTYPDARMVFASAARPHAATLAEMYVRSAAVARGLWALGLRPGDALAVQVPNWVEGALAYQAAFQIGVIVVPIIHIYGPAEVGFILRQSKAKALIVPDRWRTIDYLERVEAVGVVDSLEHLIVIGDRRPAGAHDWQSLEDRGAAPVPFDSLHVASDDPCLLLYTSGTTAEPKGVLHSHNTLIAEVDSVTGLLGRGPGAVSLAAFPAGHIGGVLNVLRMFVTGSSFVLLDQWDPVVAAAMVEEHKIKHSAGAPFFLQSLMEAARAHGNDLSSFSGFMVGAASVPASLVEEAERFGLPTYRAYGSTEHPVLTTGLPSDPLEKRATTDGRATAGNEIRILDDDGRDLPTGEEGEIVCRGPEQFLRYTNPEHEADAFLPGAWFQTGDIGRMDEEGFLTITDRKKDIIIRGGENIASKEVEDILARHPAVVESAVVGVADVRYGERVYAFILIRPGTELDLGAVQRHFVAEGVARQKTPEFIEIVDALPRGMSGKVKKFELRQQLRDRPAGL